MDLLGAVIWSAVNVLLSALITLITTWKLIRGYCRQHHGLMISYGEWTRRRMFWICLTCFCFPGVIISILHYQLFVFFSQHKNDETVNSWEAFVTQYFVVICIWLVILPLHPISHLLRFRHIFKNTLFQLRKIYLYGMCAVSCICFIGATFFCIYYYFSINFDSINSNTTNTSMRNFYVYSLLSVTIYDIYNTVVMFVMLYKARKKSRAVIEYRRHPIDTSLSMIFRRQTYFLNVCNNIVKNQKLWTH